MTAQEVLVWITRVEGDVKKVCSDFRTSVAAGDEQARAGLQEIHNRLRRLEGVVVEEMGEISSLQFDFMVDKLVSEAKAGDQLAKAKLTTLLQAMEAE